MLDLKFVREYKDKITEMLHHRNTKVDMDKLSELDVERRKIIQEVEENKSKKKTISKEVGILKQAKKSADHIIKEMKEIGDYIKEKEEELKIIEEKYFNIIKTIPNMFHHTTPIGNDECANKELHKWGTKPEFDFEPLAHWDIGENLNIIDFARATKIAGARFSVLMGDGAKLERALINFMLDTHTQNGYKEILPPFIANATSMFGTGQLPKFEEDLFKLCGDRNFYLIPTAEVPVTNLHAKETLREKDLPIYYTAYTPCFRSEAGSYGKDTRGLIRQHQFNKVELVKFTKPENSYEELDKLRENAENILKMLGLHFRTVTLCSGDLGFSASKTYDLEVWLPSANTYREISSCSNFEDFQARRAGIRYKTKEGKTAFVHTINGSGLAIGRTLLAVLENYQNKDGSVTVPDVLIPYMGKTLIK